MNTMQLLSLLLPMLTLAAGIALGVPVWLRPERARLPSQGQASISARDSAHPSGWGRQLDVAILEALDGQHPVALILIRTQGQAALPRSAQARLQEIGQRAFGRADRPFVRVVCLGEREAAMIVRWPGSDERLIDTAWRALEALDEPSGPESSYRRAHALPAHVGIAVTPRDGDTANALVNNARLRVESAIRTGYCIIAADPRELALPSAAPENAEASDSGDVTRSMVVTKPRRGARLVSAAIAGYDTP